MGERANLFDPTYRFATTISNGCAPSPPVLFLHGFMGSRHDWDEICTRLTSDFRCIQLDLPGHGDSRLPDTTLSLNWVADQLAEFLCRQELVPCNVVGYSMGGRIALILANRHPNTVARLVLESATPGLRTPSERADRRYNDSRLVERLRTVPFTTFISEWYRQPLFANIATHPRFREMFQRRCQQSPDALAWALQTLGTGTMEPLWPTLADLPSPLHVVVGEHDRKYRKIANDVAQLTSTVIHIGPDCGHNIHMPMPDFFATVLRHAFAPPSK